MNDRDDHFVPFFKNDRAFSNGEKYRRIYICPYGRDSEYVPKGMFLADTDNQDDKKSASESGENIEETGPVKEISEQSEINNLLVNTITKADTGIRFQIIPIPAKDSARSASNNTVMGYKPISGGLSMKKLLSVLLILCLMVSFTAFAEDKVTYENDPRFTLIDGSDAALNWDTVQAEITDGSFVQIGDLPYKIWIPDEMKPVDPNWYGQDMRDFGFYYQDYQYASPENENMIGPVVVRTDNFDGFDSMTKSDTADYKEIEVNGLPVYMVIEPNQIFDYIIGLYIRYIIPAGDGKCIWLEYHSFCEYEQGDGSTGTIDITDPLYYEYIKQMLCSIQPV